MRNHFRIKEGLIHKRFIFFIITIAIPRLPTLLLISLIKVSRHYIPRKIASLHPFSDIFMIAYESKKLGGSCARLIIIVHKVDLACSAICSARAPIIHNVIAMIQFTAIEPVALQSPSQAPISTVVMRQQVVVEAANLTTDASGITMHFTLFIFAVPRRIQRLRN